MFEITTLGLITWIFAVIGVLLFVTVVVSVYRNLKEKVTSFFEGGTAFDLDEPWEWGQEIGEASDRYLSNAKVELMGLRLAEPLRGTKWVKVQIELTPEDVSLIEACAERKQIPVQDYFIHLLRGDLAVDDLRKVVDGTIIEKHE